MAEVRRSIIRSALTKRRRYFRSIRKQIKDDLIAKNGYKCSVHDCGIECNLSLHHIIPLAMGGSNKIENLVVLCFKHHREIHANITLKATESVKRD